MSFALRLKSRPRTTQPKEGVGLTSAFGRPAFAVVCADGVIDLATGNLGAFTAAAKLGVIPQGPKAAIFPAAGTPHASLLSRSAYNILGPLTLVWVGVIDTLAQYQFLIARAVGNGAVNNPFEFRVNSGGGMTLTRANASNYSAWTTAQSPPIGAPVVLVATHGDSIGNSIGASLWINGVSQAVTPTYNTTGPATGNSEPLLLGTRGDLYSYMRGACMAAIGFPRVLSDSEIKSISANPWQVFAP